ncbi:MAG: hypothetical protein E4H14_12600 [Candidatus Thorarchaeota archaeon]|nr:MAG: hypothetical protein E4H14_12600 [Candidatus Thorarchaeota archaeon]
MMTYEELQKTELFSFFNFTESGRKTAARGYQEIHYKPGGFQEFIDVKMTIDRSQMVQEGVLYLDRNWIGGPMTVSPFGKDLAKSFVAAVCPKADKEQADRVVSTIWNLSGSSDRVISLHPEGSENVESEGAIEEIELVYLGVADKFEMTFEKSRIKIENVMDVGRERLKISVESIKT